ncbi:ABC transporter permease [Tessaracoccus rhinocerotis]|uniref:ABC transporter permease n=1 Tax=Tessaracoccus rhinocerotis TaxID=1689449 RepID=A0A553K5V6_9ACTN|nr:ABC transporter permease [Tessaracoccus rhinocerotis]TRY20071.1 ABC transporter permease [Tessaracoccus rhinocerotis]
MNARKAVLRAAWGQAKVTVLRKYLSPTGISLLVFPVVVLAVLWFVRDSVIDGAVGVSAWVFSGMLAFSLIAGAAIGVSAEIQQEREDGTLMRAKAVPNGVTGHLLAKLVVAVVDTAIPVVPMVVGAAIILPDLLPSDPTRWLLFVLVYALATAAMLPWGAVMGSLFRSAIGLGVASLGLYALAIIAGLFYPLTMLPAALQVVGQFTPHYWIGLGIRTVLLDDAAMGLEVGGSWRTPQMVLVLVAWAAVGLLLAPVLLRRMARRTSGSAVAEARERVLSRGY